MYKLYLGKTYMHLDKINLDLTPYNINGVIHVGANEGEYAEFYYKLGVHQVMWIEQNKNLYNTLYANTCRYGMKQLYYFESLSNAISMDQDVNTTYFKYLWRQNIVDIDIETYDALVIATDKDVENIIIGFENLLVNIKTIVLLKPVDYIEHFMNNKGYELESYTNHVLYRKTV